MAGPLIAVVGAFDAERERQLHLRNGAFARDAAEYLGRELARQGFRLVVYANWQLELDIVRGYLAHEETEPGSIQVVYPGDGEQPRFPEEKDHEDKFDFRPDFGPDWEDSFYRSLDSVDGMVILGGRESTQIAGLIAISRRKPVLACAGFGGAGARIFRSLLNYAYPLAAQDLAIMSQAKSSPELAARLVNLLHKQKSDFERQDAIRLQEEEKRLAKRLQQELTENATINWHAIVSAVLFAAAAFSWPLTSFIPTETPFVALLIVLSTPMLAGASGATIRVVLDWAMGVSRTFLLSAYNQYILLRYAALGVVAGGLAGVSFVLAQVFASDVKPSEMATTLRKLVPFVMIVGFAAGLTAEIVLSNLRKSGTPAVNVPGVTPKDDRD